MHTARKWGVASVVGALLTSLLLGAALGSWGNGTGSDAVEVQGDVVLVDTKYEITGTLTALCGDPATCNVYDDEGPGTWILDFGQQGYFLPSGFGEGPHTIQGKLARHGEIDVYVVDGASVGRSGGDPPPWAPDTDTDGLSDDAEAMLGTDPLNPDSDGDTVLDGAEDSDGDGCADGEEPVGAATPKPGATGAYDPLDPSDFFDVPVPANPDPVPNGSRSQVVNIGDVLATLTYVGTFAGDGGAPNGNGVGYDNDKDGDTVADGQDYDRSPSVAPSPPWGAGPPDGSVTIGDVLGVLAQVGLDCSGPP